MAFGNSIRPGGGSGPSGEVTITPPDQATATVTTVETTGNVTIPAGAYWAYIRNAGYVQSGDAADKSITVNGVSWSAGREETWQAFFNRIDNEYDLLPQITIVNAEGSRVFVTYAS